MSKITIDRSVVEQALTYLGDEAPLCSGCAYEWGAAIRVLRAALEQNHSEHCLDMVSQVEQGPVGCITGTYGGYPVVRLINPALVLPFGTALYTHPQNLNCKSTQARLATLWGYERPQPPRQPLTEMEIVELRQLTPGTLDVQFVLFARAIERAHGITGGVK